MRLIWMEFILGGVLAVVPTLHSQIKPRIELEVDASDAPPKIIHCTMQYDITGGDATLLYPKWIPGEHGPTGPIEYIAGLSFEADGTPLAWERDRANMFAFHLHLPVGSKKLTARMDFLASAEAGPFISGASTGQSFAILNWNELVLYPQGYDAENIEVVPKLKLAHGWHYATALKTRSNTDKFQGFEPVSLAQLIDSPILAGEIFREINLSSSPGSRHYLDLAADHAFALEISDSQIAGLRSVINETHALFGSWHYDSYHFLVSLGDQLGSTGLEHHESSDDRVAEKTFTDPSQAKLVAWLLPHEFTHSWNGKYRRPQGLINPDLQRPVDSKSLWVYEGLTTYLGELLATRAGLWTKSEFQDELALKVAVAENHPGRRWRSLRDTAVSAQILTRGSGGFDSWRCGLDYYPEGELLWLEIDCRLRELSGGKKSLDDFCRSFFAGSENGQPSVVSYDEGELIKTLDKIAPYEWENLIHRRIDTVGKQSFEFLGVAGYKMVYTNAPTPMIELREHLQHIRDARFSLGVSIREDGLVQEVIFGSLCAQAGILPGDRIIALNEHAFSFANFSEQLKKQQGAQRPLQFLIQRQNEFQTVSVLWSLGERFPRFERLPATIDLLAQLMDPLVRTRETLLDNTEKKPRALAVECHHRHKGAKIAQFRAILITYGLQSKHVLAQSCVNEYNLGTGTRSIAVRRAGKLIVSRPLSIDHDE